MPRNQYIINEWVAHWVLYCARHAKLVCLLFALLCVYLSAYTKDNLGINTKTTDMLSEKLAWRQTLMEHERYFPQLTDTLVAVIDAPTSMMALDAREQLATQLKQQKELFYDVYTPGGGDFFRNNGLLYLEVDELEELTEQLAKIQPFIARLASGGRLSGYFDLLEQSLTNQTSQSESDQAALNALFSRTTGAVNALQNQQFHRMRWDDRGATRQLIVLKPKLVFDQLLPAQQSIDVLRTIAEQLNLNATQGITVRLTGTIALQSDELKLLADSMPLSGLIALILVSVVLFFAMRHPVLILSSVTTLVVGLVLTGAFAAFSVGQLNLVSVAFAILFIGLGVDFAIHFCLRYKELLNENTEHFAALQETGRDVGTSLLLCAITTSAGFFAFIPTSFKGVSELGIISGMGIIISLITTLTLLPALLSLKPILTPALFEKAGKFTRTTRVMSERFIREPITSRRILLVFGLLVIASLFTLPSVSFDNNPLNLRSPNSESVSAYRDLLADSQTSPLSLSAISQDSSELEALKAHLDSLPSVARVISLSDFIPDQQTEKRDLLFDLQFILGGLENSDAAINLSPSSETYEQQITALRSLITTLTNVTEQSSDQNANPELQKARASLGKLADQLEQSSESERAHKLQQLSTSVLGDLLLQINQIQASLNTQGVQLADLPSALVDRWKSDNGYYKMQILPSVDMADNAQAKTFVRSVTAIAPNASGASLVNLEGGLAIVQSFQQAFISAFVIILILLLFLLRKLSDTLLVLAPLLLTAPLIVASVVLLGTSFNYANVITLPLLLGISIDNGVHMVHRARHALPGSDHLLASSTGRAVVFSAFTTIVSFGNLAFSPHIGTASMGLILSIGMICSLLCTLVLLPILINRFIVK